MNILLTGGAGYIGSHVVLALIDKGHSVTVIDDLSTGNSNLIPSYINFYNCNINNEIRVKEILCSSKFDFLMHFAGFIKVEESVKNPKKYFENNTYNSIKLFETCYKNNLKNIIFSSTASVYGNSSTNSLIPEGANTTPLNPYAESKIKTEQYLQNNLDKFNFIILRYFNVAGADQHLRAGLISKNSTHLIKIISEIAVGKRDKILIFGNDYNTPDGTAIRDYIHVSDLADIHIEVAKYLLKSKNSNLFNCGYGKGYSVNEVLKKANEITKSLIKFEIADRRLGDAEKSVADTNKLNKYIKWEPKFNDLSLIIESAIKWEKKLNEKNL